MSPSLWWDDESLLKEAKILLDQQKEMNQYVYISVGLQQHKTMVKDAKEFAEELKKAKKSKLKIDYLPLENENHATILHQSISEAFKKLFPFKA